MRPSGEIRRALEIAARQLAAEHRGATWRDLAERAGVGYLAARRTAENMERAGTLEVVGSGKRAHSRREMKLYAPRTNFATETTEAAGAPLAAVMGGWRP